MGYHKQSSLQKIEEQVFENAIDECIRRKIDFILIAGDLFHVNIPEMRIQKFAVRQLRKIHEAGIPAYVVYGSHDFSPVANSVIDLLVEAGYLIKVSKQKEGPDEKILLEFTEDPKTGAKIVGLPGLSAGKEIEYYQKLDRSTLENEKGFKIFLFHAGITELKTKTVQEGDFMPISLLPKGFDYYAGGHIHSHYVDEYNGYGKIAYPGTLFAGYHSDLEDNAKGMQRGFIIVEFDEKIEKLEFVPIENARYEIVEYNAQNKNANSVNLDLTKKIKEIDPSNKIIIIKVWGELASGKTTEIDFTKIRDELKEKGALDIKIHRSNLSSKEYTITTARGKNKDEIETNVFKENIGGIHLKQQLLQGDSGVKLAKQMLQDLSQPIQTNEKKQDYQKRIQDNALKILGLELN